MRARCRLEQQVLRLRHSNKPQLLAFVLRWRRTKVVCPPTGPELSRVFFAHLERGRGGLGAQEFFAGCCNGRTMGGRCEPRPTHFSSIVVPESPHVMAIRPEICGAELSPNGLLRLNGAAITSVPVGGLAQNDWAQPMRTAFFIAAKHYIQTVDRSSQWQLDLVARELNHLCRSPHRTNVSLGGMRSFKEEAQDQHRCLIVWSSRQGDARGAVEGYCERASIFIG